MTRQAEPEWDDATRALVEGMDRHDTVDTCPGCGVHEVLRDPNNPDAGFELPVRHCPICAAQAAKGRELAEVDKKWTEQHKQAPPKEKRPGDGRHVYLRRLTPNEIKKRRDNGRQARKRRR